MTDHSPTSADRPQPSDVRFSIRGLLLVMVGVSVAAAAMGPYFRSLTPEERAPVALLWGVCGAFVLGWLVYHGRNRYRLEREAGPKIIGLAPRGRWIRNRPPWLTVLGGCLWIAFGLYYLILREMTRSVPGGASVSIFSLLFTSLFCAIFIALGITTIWWSRETQLRENGILHGLGLLRWTHVTDHEWTNGGVRFEGVNHLHQDVELGVNVPIARRTTVEELLAAKLHERIHTPSGDSANEVAPAVVLPPISVTPRQHISWRRMMMGLAAYIAMILVIAVRPWGAPPVEFNMGAIGAWAIVFVASLFLRRPVKTAGAPLIRLRVNTDWLRTLGALLVALGGYYANQHMITWTHPMLSGALGFMSGLGVASIIKTIIRDQIDLCENGIVLVRWDYWPWESVTVTRWNRDTNGPLVLNRGWRRVIAKVRPEQRDAVDTVLKDKVRTESPANLKASIDVVGRDS